MISPRDLLKSAIIRRLDAAAMVHRLGHQAEYANRYVLASPGGASLEIMFEKSPRTPANIWCLESAAKSVSTYIKRRPSPKALLWTKTNKDGDILYGRHSALEKMPQLGDADLLCFAPATLGEADEILDALVEASRLHRV